ncbi:MAG: hypothetical protein ACM369_03655, partial [Acidobacteriota bacterium]
AASATQVDLFLLLQILPVFIERPLLPELDRSGLEGSFAKDAPTVSRRTARCGSLKRTFAMRGS